MLCGISTLLFNGYPGIVPRSKAALTLKLTTSPSHPTSTLRITGAIPLLRHLPSWHAVGQIYLKLYKECGKYYLLTYSIEQSPSWEANWFCSWSRNSPHFMEQPESSLPYPQAPTTCPYLEPTPSSPHHPFPLPEDPSQYYPPIYVLVSPMVFFPQVSPPKPCAHLSLPPYVPDALPISFFSILSHPHNIWWGVQRIKLLIM